MHAIYKILANASGKKTVKQGEIVNAEVDSMMIHERQGTFVVKKLAGLGISKIRIPGEKLIAVFDHEVPPSKIESAESQKIFRDFLKEQENVNVYHIGEGICHQIVSEKGHIYPGMVYLGLDSHTVTSGAFGAFATGIGVTETVSVLLTGKIWLKIPPVIKFNITGNLKPHVMAKDIILHILGKFGQSFCVYKGIEFSGPTLKTMPIDERMVLSNMSIEIGAKFGYIQPDDITREYLKGRVKNEYQIFETDDDFEYDEEYEINVEGLSPQVACPHFVDNVKGVEQVEGTEIDQVFIGSCTGGRYHDIETAAKIIGNNKIPKGLKFLISPASKEIYLKALDKGIIKQLINAGAVIMHPNCSNCTAMHLGFLATGERSVSTANRNFRGRIGSYDSEIYLASPATAAASALKGVITDPRKL